MSVIKPINRFAGAKTYSWLLLSSWKNSTYSLLYQLSETLETFQLLVVLFAACNTHMGQCGYNVTTHLLNIVHERYYHIMPCVDVRRVQYHLEKKKHKAWCFNWQEYLSNYHFSACSPCWDYVIIFLKHCGTILLFCVSFLRRLCTWHSASHLIICWKGS